MIDWGLMALCIVMMLLGFFELYRTFRFYKWDKKTKEMPTAPYVIYFGIFFSGVLIVVSAMFIMGNTSLTLPKIFLHNFGNYSSSRGNFNVSSWTPNVEETR